MGKRACDEILIQLLAEGKSQKDAAQAVGVSTRTVRRRMNDAIFVDRVIARRRRIADGMTDNLILRTTDALDVLVDVMRNSTDDRQRVKAATAVLDLAEPVLASELAGMTAHASAGDQLTEKLDEMAGRMAWADAASRRRRTEADTSGHDPAP